MSLVGRWSVFPACTLLFSLTIATAPAAAQADEPIGRYVADARGSLAFFGQNDKIAASLAVPGPALPPRGLGVEFGAHMYPFRYRAITFGIGGSFHASGADKTPEIPEGQTQPPGPTVRTRFRAFSPQLSFNFGKHNGWSYISGGMGFTTLTIRKIAATATAAGSTVEEEPGRRAKTINYGGGARWFTNDHIAFTVDVRFYAISPLLATETEPPTPRMTLMVISVGASFK